MAIDEYSTPDGTPFTIIANHGGISISYDYGVNNQNIGLDGLNVSQYYSVRTDPTDPSVIYAGSQDQGIQRTIDGQLNGPKYFEQLVSGDYGHIVFTGGQYLWTVYPEGWVTYYDEPKEHGYFASFQLDYAMHSAWLPPLVPATDENKVYLLGGSMTNSGGSHIIELQYANEEIFFKELPFDFHDYTDEGYVSAMAISPFNPNVWYSATSNGFMFVSQDAGENWEQSIVNIPEPHYLYGSKILCSELYDGQLFVVGSGYSGLAMLHSQDFGNSFEAVGKGLPPTTILDIVINEDETLLFAATEAGPYVFNMVTKEWLDMSGQTAPNTTYWSVEYLKDQKIIRYGTYGRGIFDFHLDEITSNASFQTDNGIHIFPNPANHKINIDIEKWHEVERIKIFDIHGKEMDSWGIIRTAHFLDISSYLPGIYHVQIQYKKASYITKPFIKI